MQKIFKTIQIEFFPILVFVYNVKIFLSNFNNYSRAPSEPLKTSPNFLFKTVSFLVKTQRNNYCESHFSSI